MNQDDSTLFVRFRNVKVYFVCVYLDEVEALAVPAILILVPFSVSLSWNQDIVVVFNVIFSKLLEDRLFNGLQEHLLNFEGLGLAVKTGSPD